MQWIDLIRFMHVLGACVLIGTGAGIAFFMLMAHRTQNASTIAHTASVVVVADLLFTTTAAILQPVTGLILMWNIGWHFTDGWLALSLVLYIVIGIFWLPVIFIQIKMRDDVRASIAQNSPLSARYFRLYRIWFACGVPAFISILALLWLMLIRP